VRPRVKLKNRSHKNFAYFYKFYYYSTYLFKIRYPSKKIYVLKANSKAKKFLRTKKSLLKPKRYPRSVVYSSLVFISPHNQEYSYICVLMFQHVLWKKLLLKSCVEKWLFYSGSYIIRVKWSKGYYQKYYVKYEKGCVNEFLVNMPWKFWIFAMFCVKLIHNNAPVLSYLLTITIC